MPAIENIYIIESLHFSVIHWVNIEFYRVFSWCDSSNWPNLWPHSCNVRIDMAGIQYVFECVPLVWNFTMNVYSVFDGKQMTYIK